MLLLTEKTSKSPYNDSLEPINQVLVDACLDLGVRPTLMDIGEYVHGQAFKDGHVDKTVSEAIRSADVVLNVVDYIHFSRLVGFGSNEEGAWLSDQYVTGEQRLFALQSHGMNQWEITDEQIAMISRRAHWLVEQVRKSGRISVTGVAGTSFSCRLGDASNVLPFLCLVPLYGEVPVIPAQGTEEGILVVDGPTQQGIRPKNELDREPLSIVIEGGKVVDFCGDPQQVARLKAFIEGGDPKADSVDEVGILTTDAAENDKYWWEDGTHHHDRTHIAIGNNVLRSENVHGKAHMDCEIGKPTVTVDELTVVRDGVFADELIGEWDDSLRSLGLPRPGGEAYA